MLLEKTLESPLDCKAIQPVHPKDHQSWVFIGRTDVEAETPIFWPPDVNSWLLWKDPYAGKDWGQKEKGTAEDEVIRRHHQLNEHGFWWTPGVGDRQGGLACCSSCGHKVYTIFICLFLTYFSSLQLLSLVWPFVTPWTTALQASLSITNSWRPPEPMSIETMMPSNHLIHYRPLLLLPSIFPSIRVFSNESALHITWPNYWSFSFSISPSNEHPGLISFMMDWLDLLAV